MKKRRYRVMRYKRKGFFRRKSKLKVLRTSGILKPEVKSTSNGATDQSVQTYKYTTPTYDLSSFFTHQVDVLSVIQVGTNNNQRIGSKIFVKKILYEIWGDICPKFLATPTTAISCNTTMLRFIFDTNRDLAPTGYWRNSVVYPIMARPDRRAVGIHLDRTYNIDGYLPGQVSGGVQQTGLGKTFKKTFTFNLNRSVTFNPNTGQMKNDSDVYTMRMIGYMPNLTSNTSYQTHCVMYRTSIYFTDD